MAKKAAAKVEKKPKKAKAATEFAPMQFKDHTITQKRTGKFAVVNSKGKPVNGADKVKILTEAKVMKGSFKKAATEEARQA